MSANSQDSEKSHYLKVTEEDAYGKRELVFTPLYDESDGLDDHWEYVYVTEYR